VVEVRVIWCGLGLGLSGCPAGGRIGAHEFRVHKLRVIWCELGLGLSGCPSGGRVGVRQGKGWGHLQKGRGRVMVRFGPIRVKCRWVGWSRQLESLSASGEGRVLIWFEPIVGSSPSECPGPHCAVPACTGHKGSPPPPGQDTEGSPPHLLRAWHSSGYVGPYQGSTLPTALAGGGGLPLPA